MTKRDLDLLATRRCAAHLRSAYFDDKTPKEDPQGRSAEHIAWMLDRIWDDDMTLAKASRWLGYCQAWVVLHHHTDLKYVKSTTRFFRDSKENEG